MNAIIELAVSFIGSVAVMALVGAYIVYAETIIEATVDALEVFLFPPAKPAPTTHGELVALYGEAVDA